MNANILVVDDEPGILRLCQRLLSKAGANVLTASTANLGMSLLNKQKIDVLLADIRMPGLNGYQLMESAREIQPEIAVILMTGYGTIETAIEVLHRGADGLILKPFAGSDLVQGVQVALEASKQRLDSLRLRLLRPLFDTIKQLSSINDLEELLDEIISAVNNHLKCSNILIMDLYNDGHPSLLLRSTGVFTKIADFQGLENYVYSVSQSNGLDWSEGRSGYSYHQYLEFEQLDFTDHICIPIAGKHHTRIILTGRVKGEPHFREVEVEILAVLWAQANAALENVLLYEQLRRSMTELEKSQHTLLQYEKMATAGRLTASIAHEINNPLQSLSNCLHLIGRDELDLTVRKKYMVTAQTELERLTDTVQRMLDLYRPVARQRQLVSLPKLIQHVLFLMEQQIDKNNIGVDLNINQDIPQINAVGSQIQQVLLNLLLNAVEAMPNGGEIKIIVEDIHDGVQIIIRDSGQGISKEQREMIFEPFVSTKDQGIGLGLSISYGILQAHGGSLELLPEDGSGACFRIFLPIGDI